MKRIVKKHPMHIKTKGFFSHNIIFQELHFIKRQHVRLFIQYAWVRFYHTNSGKVISTSFSFSPVNQSVATRAVNQAVVSSKSKLDQHCFPSMRQASFIFHQWVNSLFGKEASCLERMLCGLLVWESQTPHA